jgi:hypothetical protein
MAAIIAIITMTATMTARPCLKIGEGVYIRQ